MSTKKATHAVYTITKNGARRAHTRFLATVEDGHVIEFGLGSDMGKLEGNLLQMAGLAGGSWRVSLVQVVWDGTRYADAK